MTHILKFSKKTKISFLLIICLTVLAALYFWLLSEKRIPYYTSIYLLKAKYSDLIDNGEISLNKIKTLLNNAKYLSFKESILLYGKIKNNRLLFPSISYKALPYRPNDDIYYMAVREDKLQFLKFRTIKSITLHKDNKIRDIILFVSPKVINFNKIFKNSEERERIKNAYLEIYKHCGAEDKIYFPIFFKTSPKYRFSTLGVFRNINIKEDDHIVYKTYAFHPSSIMLKKLIRLNKKLYLIKKILSKHELSHLIKEEYKNFSYSRIAKELLPREYTKLWIPSRFKNIPTKIVSIILEIPVILKTPSMFTVEESKEVNCILLEAERAMSNEK